MIQDPDTVFQDEVTTSACRALWRGVLIQAYRDATRKVHPNSASKIREDYVPQEIRVIHSARSWLCKPTLDLTTVCDHAGLNHEFVVKEARQLKATEWPRETLGHLRLEGILD